jgi:hypothetical protein
VIAGVLSPEAWAILAKQKLDAAMKGDLVAFAWCERMSLNSATLADLHLAEAEEVAQVAQVAEGAKQDLIEATEAVLKEEIQRYLIHARVGKLAPEERQRVLEIRKVLNEIKTVEKMPDFSGLTTAEAEEELFHLESEKKQLLPGRAGIPGPLGTVQGTWPSPGTRKNATEDVDRESLNG